MSVKLNKNLLNTQKNLFNNHVKTFTGFYSDSWNSFITSATSSTAWGGLAINEDGLCFAIQNISSNVLNYSRDGGNSWVTLTLGTSNLWRSITYSKELDRFVVVGEGPTHRIMYSNKPNPINVADWSIATSGVQTMNYQDVIYSAGVFIACANSGNDSGEIDLFYRRILVSFNGINWRVDSPPLTLSEQRNLWKTISYGNGTFIIASNGVGASSPDTTLSRLIYSTNDGNTWSLARSSKPSIITSNNGWQDSAYSPKLNLFILVGNSGPNRLIYSNNGQNWTDNRITASINNLQLTAITWSPELELFIAVDSTSANKIFITSGDGINWTFRFLSIRNKTNANFIIWNKKHNNFIISFTSATTNNTNISNTKPLGINSISNFIQNTQELTSFSYFINQNESEILMYRNINFGISPIINVNVNNSYFIDREFPNGISLNTSNGVIYGNYTGSEESIERKIKVLNNSTNQTIETLIKINFITIPLLIDTFYYYIDNQNTPLLSSLSSPYKINLIKDEYVFLPFVSAKINPLFFSIDLNPTNFLINLDQDKGIIKINRRDLNLTSTVSELEIQVKSEIEEFDDIKTKLYFNTEVKTPVKFNLTDDRIIEFKTVKLETRLNRTLVFAAWVAVAFFGVRFPSGDGSSDWAYEKVKIYSTAELTIKEYSVTDTKYLPFSFKIKDSQYVINKIIFMSRTISGSISSGSLNETSWTVDPDDPDSESEYNSYKNSLGIFIVMEIVIKDNNTNFFTNVQVGYETYNFFESFFPVNTYSRSSFSVKNLGNNIYRYEAPVPIPSVVLNRQVTDIIFT